jgi:hypothetical protein
MSDVRSFDMLKRFWFGITIIVSTLWRSSASPCSANLERLLPSKRKGLVTTATVRMPASSAACAITGAAPVPVPPPMPAVTNIYQFTVSP